MAKQRGSIDGFIPRRPGVDISKTGETSRQRQRLSDNNTRVSTQTTANTMHTRNQRPNGQISTNRADLEESLRGLNDTGSSTAAPKLSRKERLKLRKQANKKNRQAKSRKKKIIKWVIITAIVLALAIGGWIGYKLLAAGNSVFDGNIFGALTHKPLKQDKNGRSNILILGTTDDDDGRPGAELTDSMMVLSVDQNKKDAYMISIPRDLWVDYGKTCSNGNQGKINANFQCAKDSGRDKNQIKKANADTAKIIGNVMGIDIQYGVNVNRNALHDLVKSIGGIDVTIKSRNPNGLLDSNFDKKMCGAGKVSFAQQQKKCPPSGHFIDFPNGKVHLNANQATYLSQARGYRAPTYGFEQANFDREKNQQMILKAIQKKATSAGTLANIGAVTSLIDAIGDNLVTSFDTSEIRTLVDLGNEIKQSKIKSISLVDADPDILQTDSLNGQSIVRPIAGLFDYSGVREYVNKKLVHSELSDEAAKTVVLNASDQEGAAGKQADILSEKGLDIVKTGNAKGDYQGVSIYKVSSSDTTATRTYLAKLFSVSIKNETPADVSFPKGTDYVIILGEGAIVAGDMVQ